MILFTQDNFGAYRFINKIDIYMPNYQPRFWQLQFYCLIKNFYKFCNDHEKDVDRSYKTYIREEGDFITLILIRLSLNHIIVQKHIKKYIYSK